MSFRDGKLVCDMHAGCTGEVTHIDEKGFVYCTTDADKRRGGCRIRKLRPHETNKLKRGDALGRY